MRHGDESVQAAEWAWGVLSTLAPLAEALGLTLDALPGHVHQEVGPPHLEPDVLVVYSAGEPQDRAALGDADRLGSRVPLIVKVVLPEASYSPHAAAVRAIYQRLHGATDEAIPEGGRMATCLRTSGIAYPEISEGVQHRHLGHVFQVEID